MIVSRHAAQRFMERVHAIQNPKETLATLYVRSLPADVRQRKAFGVEQVFRGNSYRRALYFHPDRQCTVEVLLVIRHECIVTVLIRTSAYQVIVARIGGRDL
jgi:hypothetical protein